MAVSDYVCVTVRSRPGEGADAFGKRLIGFWSDVLRARKPDYERVYAETTRFEPAGDRVTRQYMMEAGVADVIAGEMSRAGIDHDPIDPDDVYSKYEATPPEWFQIPH
jgi:hypothetical protein